MFNNTITTVEQADEKNRSDCGSVIKIKAEIRQKCGVRQMNPSHYKGYRKSTAAVSVLFLGGFGAHKFYLEQIG